MTTSMNSAISTASAAMEVQELLAPGVPHVADPANQRLKVYGIAHPNEVFRDGQDLSAPSERMPSWLGKLTAYAQPRHIRAWKSTGYRMEARIRGYFRNGSDALLFVQYPDRERREEIGKSASDDIVRLACSKARASGRMAIAGPAHDSMPSRSLNARDAEQISALLRMVFADYPTPLDATYLADCIDRKRHAFRGAFTADGRLIACASAEMDHRQRSVEMTDCATLPEYRGRGLVTQLLEELGREVHQQFGYRHFYTIARAGEVGMNIAFARLGYVYTGRLVNNCRMPEGWESMNVWCRRIG